MNHNWIHFPNFKEEMTELYANRAIRYFGASLVYVFIPVYLLNIGFSFQQVILYLIFKKLFMALFVPVAVFFDGKIGIKHTAMFSSFILSSFLLYLYSGFSVSLISLFILGVFEGFHLALYWVPTHTNFMLASKKEKAGKETATIIILPKIAGVFAPIIGALIIATFGFQTLLISACLIIFASMLPLFMSSERILSTREPFRILLKEKTELNGLFIIEGILAVSVFTWPLFVFMFNQTYEFVGIAASIQVIAAVFTTALAGFLSDKFPVKKLFPFAGIFSAFIFFSAIFASSQNHVLILSFFTAIAEIFIVVLIFTRVIKKSEKREIPTVIAFREIVLSLSISTILLMFLFVNPSIAFKTLFFITAISCICLAFYYQKK